MTYNHAEFIDSLENRRDPRAFERAVRDLGHSTVALISMYPDESGDLSHYGTWSARLNRDYTVDRKDAVLYAEYKTIEYRYITRSEKRALALAAKRAYRDGFQLDEDSDHAAEVDVDRQGNSTTVTYSGWTIAARDLWVNSRFDSRRDLRYFEPESDEVQYMIQDHHRMEQLCNDDWTPVYLEATVYYRGFEIAEESVSGYESDTALDKLIPDLLSGIDIPAARLAKIAEMLHSVQLLQAED